MVPAPNLPDVGVKRYDGQRIRFDSRRQSRRIRLRRVLEPVNRRGYFILDYFKSLNDSLDVGSGLVMGAGRCGTKSDRRSDVTPRINSPVYSETALVHSRLCWTRW
jgi:hypothetical protein